MKRILPALLVALAASSAFAQQGQAPAVAQLKRDPAGGRAALGLPPIAYGLMTGHNVINAENLGLTCDNSTDNAPVFSAIHNITQSTPGYFVYFPPQTNFCLTSNYMTVDPGTTFWAAPHTVMFKPTAGSTAMPLLLEVTYFASNVLVHGLTFDGALSSTQTNSSNVVQSFNGVNIVFDDIDVQNTRGVGVIFSYSTGGLTNSGVRHSRFANVGNFWTFSNAAADRKQGLAFTGDPNPPVNAYGNFATDNVFNDIGLDHMSVTNQNDFRAIGNHCFATAYQFPGLTTSSYNACVYVSLANNVTITHNVSVGVSGIAFDVTALGAGTGYGDIIEDNTAIASGQAGIGISGLTNFIISGNNITNGGHLSTSSLKGGITLTGVDTNGSIAGNVITDTQATPTQPYGIQFATVGGVTPTVTNVKIDQTNVMAGMVLGNFNGGAGFTNFAVDTFANRPISPAVGTHYFATDLGTGLDLIWTGAKWKPAGGTGVLYRTSPAGGIATVTNNSSETNLASYLIPAGLMSANGELEITVGLTSTTTVNTKGFIMRLSPTAGVLTGGLWFCNGNIGASQLFIRSSYFLANSGSTSTQVASALNPPSGGWGGTGNAIASGTSDTTKNQYVVINSAMAGATDNLTLSAVTIKWSEP